MGRGRDIIWLFGLHDTSAESCCNDSDSPVFTWQHPENAMVARHKLRRTRIGPMRPCRMSNFRHAILLYGARVNQVRCIVAYVSARCLARNGVR